MNVLAWILGIGLVVVFGAAGLTKLMDLDRMRDHLGYSVGQYRLIGLAEIIGVAGVLVGLLWRKVEYVGGAAGVGIVCLMFGALMAHARVEDPAKKTVPAVVMMVVAIIYIVALSLR